MRTRVAALLGGILVCGLSAVAQVPVLQPPQAGPVEILKVSRIQAGMTGTAWTVFAGMEPEPVPVEILGVMKNAWGPKQDIILAKLGGKAQHTNVAGGMSGSPVYIDGKLIGAIALRFSIFSPDAICGITPIELMLELPEFDNSVPDGARTPDKLATASRVEVPETLLAKVLPTKAASRAPGRDRVMIPIETPLTFSGFQPAAVREFAPIFEQLGLAAVQGGASGALADPTPAPGWRDSLRPGDTVAGVLVSVDMSVTGLGTVTYNDGKRILAFGHPFFNLGPVDMPMSKGEILMVLSSAYQPNKFANATEIVGALRQDRHSGILGVLGEKAPTIPVSLRVRTFDDGDTVRKQKEFHFNVFVQQKWTPFLMMMTLFNSVSGLNDFAQETTYRLSGEVELADGETLSLSTMLAGSERSVPTPMLLAGWWADKFNRLFQNPVDTPRLRAVHATIDLLPERRTATIETAWAAVSEVEAGETVPVKVFLQPYRGKRIERNIRVAIPPGFPAGKCRILLSDATTLNRMQNAAGQLSRFMDLPRTVSLINQERSNSRMYVSLLQARPTLYYEDKILPSLPASVANIMQSGAAGNRRYVMSGESILEQSAVSFNLVITGSYSLKIKVK